MTSAAKSPLSAPGVKRFRRTLLAHPWYVGVMFALVLLAATVMLKGHAPEAASAPYLHLVEPYPIVESAGYEVERRFTGTVSARQHADMGFEQAGKLAQVLVDEGEAVSQGAVLAVLDTELLRIQRRELQAQLDETQARLELVQSNLKRQRSLRQSGYTSEQRPDELEAERAALLAGLARLDASVASVTSRIRKSTLVAPFEGIVTRRYADQGAVLNPGVALLRVQQQGAMEVHIGVPARLLSRLEPGKAVDVDIHGETHQAHVLALGADVHPVTRTVTVRLGLTAPSSGILNGDLAQIALTERVQQDGYWVPTDAITDGLRGLWNVYALTPMDENRYQLEARDVHISHSTADGVFVTGAIKPGDQIAAMGLQRFVPGQQVRINPGE